MIYDAENRLIEVKKNSMSMATFTYDGDGRQMKSTINGVKTSFIGAHYEETDGVVTKYYYAGSQRIAMRKNGTLNFILGDHLGSTSLVTDAAGTVISQQYYKAWGETRYASGTEQTRYQYTGQYSYTADFGLMFYNARWYDPYLNHFTQPDSIVPEPYNSQDWDRYAYARNNPVKYTDPSGHMVDDGCRTEGCKLSQYQKDQDAQKLALLQAEADYRNCRKGNANYCSSADEWAWDHIPSTIIFRKGANIQFGFGGEFGPYREVGYAFNWRTFEHGKIYIQGRYAYIGTPQLFGVGLYKGISLVYGASSISNLQGTSNGAGGTGGATLNASYSASIAVDEDGVRLIDRGSSRPIQSHAINLGAGFNVLLVNAPGAGGILSNDTTNIGQPASTLESIIYYLLSFMP